MNEARERLAVYGPEGMTDAELLALAAGLTLAQARAVIDAGPAAPLTPARASRVMAVRELARRGFGQPGKGTSASVRHAAEAAALLRPKLRTEQEAFAVLALDAQHRVKAIRVVALGSVTQVEVHPREVFAVAVEARAASIICAHSHPSGLAEPSSEDLMLTKRLREAGQLLGIPVLDHIIIAGDSYVSLAERGQV